MKIVQVGMIIWQVDINSYKIDKMSDKSIYLFNEMILGNYVDLSDD